MLPSYPDFESDALAGKTIVITGAGSGLGAALAYHCAALGAELILMGRTAGKLETTSDAIVDAGYHMPYLHPVDLAHLTPEKAVHIAHGVARVHDKIDGLVHCAAQLGSLTPLSHTPSEQWLRLMQINCHAALYLSQALLPLLKRSTSPCLLFTGDQNAHDCNAYWGGYAASKNALLSVARLFEQENPDICVKTLTPGPMQTAIRANAYPGEASGKQPLPEVYVSPFIAALLGR